MLQSDNYTSPVLYAWKEPETVIRWPDVMGIAARRISMDPEAGCHCARLEALYLHLLHGRLGVCDYDAQSADHTPWDEKMQPPHC